MFEATFKAGLAKATPEQRERVKALRRASDTHDSPERQAARAEIARSVHGIDAVSWRCACGLAYAYPSSTCSCSRPYPRRCLTPACGRTCEPEDKVTLGGDVFVGVDMHCRACRTDIGRKSRGASFARSSIPPRERALAPNVYAYPEQAEALQAIDEWVAMGPMSTVWKRDKSDVERALSSTCALYLGGKPGLGKSVLAAHAIHRAYVDCALVTDFRWHSQASLQQLFFERFARDSDRAREHADRALTEWGLVAKCPLLVIDDLFAQTITPAFGEALCALIRERLDHVLPTVITSNVRPQWGVYFEADAGRLDSRWMAYGRELVLRGEDLRRAA